MRIVLGLVGGFVGLVVGLRVGGDGEAKSFSDGIYGLLLGIGAGIALATILTERRRNRRADKQP
jgi:hypothetical protein